MKDQKPRNTNVGAGYGNTAAGLSLLTRPERIYEEKEMKRVDPPKMTMKRYLELARISKDLVDFLRRRGVKRFESCLIREIAGNLWEISWL